MTEKQIKEWMGLLLLGGIYFSILIVTIGGIWYLYQHGQLTLQHILTPDTNYSFDIFTIWSIQHLLTPIGLIEFGMLVLVLIQVARVALLLCYYLYNRDYWFILFSSFILSVILYSFIWQS